MLLNRSSPVIQKVEMFLAGFLWTALAFASLNAISYFVRSEGWGNLLGDHPGNDEAIGFPMLIWHQGGSFFSYNAMIGDILFAASVGTLAGVVVLLGSKFWLSGANILTDDQAVKLDFRFQFSLRGLLLFTAVISVVAGITANIPGFNNSVAVLVLFIIYLVGPAIVLLLWQFLPMTPPLVRSLLVLFVMSVLAGIAMFCATLIEGLHDFARAMLGLFIYWTPQCFVFAFVIYVWECFVRWRKLGLLADMSPENVTE